MLTATRRPLLAAWIALAVTAAIAQESTGRWSALFRHQAGDYVITCGTDRSKATMVAEPVLRWSQPVRGTDDGAVYLWIRDGRPEAAGALFTMKDGQGQRTLVHEFHSLAPWPVSAEWRGRTAWNCLVEGVERKPIPEAHTPADSVPARLRQMQDLAREFSANSIDRQGSPWKLRLLPKPLYRYESTRPEVIDGALFAFVQGTDPDLLLLLEATREGTEPVWKYAVAPFTDFGLQVHHKTSEVLSTPVAVQLEGRSGPHVGFVVERHAGGNPDDFDKP